MIVLGRNEDRESPELLNTLNSCNRVFRTLDVLTNAHLDVVLELRRDGDDGGALRHCALDEAEDLLVLLLGLRLLDDVDLVL